MTIINDNTVVVFSYQELKTALEIDNGYIYIYFGASITLTGGITIHRNKTNVILDGTYNNVRYTFTDRKSSATGDTISAQYASIKSVTFKNVDATGYNYYGLIYVPENSSLKDVVVIYENLTYVGCQLTFHPMGLSRYLNCNITIQDSYLSGNEVAECNKIEIGGTTTILHKSTGNSSFWFRNTNPSFKILPDAMVTFTSVSRELIYGTNTLNFQVLNGAYLSITTKNGMGYSNYGTGNTLLDSNATLKINQTSVYGSNPTWYITGSFLMNENSKLEMKNSYSGISSNNYNLYFNSASASFTLNNPTRFVLYNLKANVIYSNANIPYSFTFSRLNMWNTASSLLTAGTLDDIPNYAWYKETGQGIIAGTFNNTITNISTNNFTAEELKVLPALTNFQIGNKKALSIGTMPLMINALSDTDIIIKGVTTPNAQILLSYQSTSKTIIADETGAFQDTLSASLPVGTIVSFIANIPGEFIYKNTSVQIVYPGDLILEEAPTSLTFSLTPFHTNPVLCPRKSEATIKVLDSRLVSTDWKLFAVLVTELKSEENHYLKDGLVFFDANSIQILGEEKLLIYEGSQNEGDLKVTTINWDITEGIVLQILEAIYNNEIYKATVSFILEA